MTTLLKNVSYSGICLTSGKNSEIEIKPGDKGQGIIFQNANTGESFKANIDNALDTSHAVTLGKPSFHVKVVEHLLAAISLAQVTDITIVVNGDEIPIADGSSKVYYELIQQAGLDTEPSENKYTLNNPFYHSSEHTSISAYASDSFRITYAVNYVNSPFNYSWYKWETKTDTINDIVAARTFGYVKDLSTFQSMGLALGVTRENTIGLNDDGTFTTKLRYNNEPIRHKILDIIGDLTLSGINPLNLNAHIIVIECGHTQHCKLARFLKDNVSLI
ncbi:MAG: UDP-3-O-acyl-N-acetylglucosamine deacetylase [Vampirovibrionia bacterium]